MPCSEHAVFTHGGFHGRLPLVAKERCEKCDRVNGRAWQFLRPAGRLLEPRDRGAQVGLRGVPELHDVRVSFECLLYQPALHPVAAAVDEPDLAQPCIDGGADVLVYHRHDVTGAERMEIEHRLDRDSVDHVTRGRSP